MRPRRHVGLRQWQGSSHSYRTVGRRSADRIRRADPLLMGAAIAYNSLFALVPLATAFVATLSFFDRIGLGTRPRSTRRSPRRSRRTSPSSSRTSSRSRLGGSRTPREVRSSPSRSSWPSGRDPVPCMRSRRPCGPSRDTKRHRGYLVARLLGIGVTIAAGIGVMIAYLFVARGWSHLDRDLGSDRNRRWQCRPRHRLRRSRRVGLAVVVGHLPVGSTRADAPFGSQRWHRVSGPGGRLDRGIRARSRHSTRRRFPSSEPSASSSSGCTSSASSWSPSPRSSWPCPRQ